jgi:uncharacterized repeat protein (TIGR01451 family)
MTRTCILLSLLLLNLMAVAQAPAVAKTSYIRTSSLNSNEYFFDMLRTPDSGWVLVGADTGFYLNTTDLFSKETTGRPWIVKLDKSGNTTWSRNSSSQFVDPHASAFLSLTNSNDGGYVTAGYAAYYNNSYDTASFLVTKYNSSGTLIWQKFYGGSGSDRAYSISQTLTDGFIVAGVTNSANGDVVGNHRIGTEDVWLVRLDDGGNIRWKKCFGGIGKDSAYKVVQTADYGFLIAGSSTSADGNLTGNNGGSDGWLIKTDSLGNLIWQSNYGSTGNEVFKDMVVNSDGTVTLAGYTSSPSVYGKTNHGRTDVWVVTTSATGTLLWSGTYGGTLEEQGMSIKMTLGNEYFITGYTASADGDVSGYHGGGDAWALRVGSSGNLVWQRCIGTARFEAGTAGFYVGENDYRVAGTATENATVYYDAYLAQLGDANAIKGFLYNDANSNGIFDAGEQPFNQAIVKTTGPGFEQQAIPAGGLFEMHVDTGSYTTSVQVSLPYYTVVPPSVNSSFSTYFNTDSFSLAVQPVPNKKDLVVNAFALGVARPGFYVDYKIHYRNAGTQSVPSGSIVFKRDSRLTLVAANPLPAASSSEMTIWNYTGLNPGDSSSITVRFQVASPPAGNLGDTLTSLALIIPISGDETPGDDSSWIKQRVIGSFDPNDKSENNAGRVPSSFIAKGEYLQYVIRFQNTGTDTAFNVVVRDTLDARLDWNTLQMVASSHSYRMTIDDGNKLAWNFNGINLPDSNVNEPASHGYIVYRIRPKSTVAANDVIHNTASIYFDFNLPVLTNDASTEVRDDLTVLPVVLVEFSGRMNGRKADLSWKTEDAASLQKFEVQRSLNGRDYTTIGILSSTGPASSYGFSDDLSQISAPVVYYRLKMMELDGKTSFSPVLVFREKGVGSQLLVYPNPVKGSAFISFMSPVKARIELQLTDAAGRLVLRRNCDVEKGNNILSLSGLERFVPGTYTVQLINGAERLNSRIVIQ